MAKCFQAQLLTLLWKYLKQNMKIALKQIVFECDFYDFSVLYLTTNYYRVKKKGAISCCVAVAKIHLTLMNTFMHTKCLGEMKHVVLWVATFYSNHRKCKFIKEWFLQKLNLSLEESAGTWIFEHKLLPWKQWVAKKM